MKALNLLLLCFSFSFSCAGQIHQYVGKYTLSKQIKSPVLYDSFSKTRFILDTANIYITAIAENGDTLWRTDPWKDNNLMEYRVTRPIIVYFDLARNKWTDEKDVIWITYNNTQFGIIDKGTGKFTWFGQD